MVVAQVHTQIHIRDTALLADALRGEERALGQLFDRHSTAVYSVAKRILQDAASAEDVMHGIFMLMWREPTIFLRTEGSLRDMLVLLSRNRSIVVLRDRVDKGLHVAAPLMDRYETAKRRSATAKAFLTVPLSDEHFLILDMAFFKGLTISEIATGTGRSPQAVKKDLCLALQQLI